MKIRQKFVKNLTNEFVIRHFPVDEQVFVTILGVGGPRTWGCPLTAASTSAAPRPAKVEPGGSADGVCRRSAATHVTPTSIPTSPSALADMS